MTRKHSKTSSAAVSARAFSGTTKPRTSISFFSTARRSKSAATSRLHGSILATPPKLHPITPASGRGSRSCTSGRARRAAAEAAYQRLLAFEPGNIAVRLGLATLLEKAGRLPEAITLLEKGSGVESDARLAPLYLKGGQNEDAFAALERIPPPAHLGATLQFATGLAEKGERKLASAVVTNALHRSADARGNFALQSRLVELLAAEDPLPVRLRAVQRLRQMSGELPEMLAGYYELLLRRAPQIGLEQQALEEIDTDWAKGEGLLPAGVALLAHQLAREDAAGAETTCAKLLARPDTTEAVAQKMVALLDDAKRPELAASAQAQVAKLNPLNFPAALDEARRLHALQRTSEAFAVLEALTARALSNEEIQGRVAQTYAELGAADRAKALFESVFAADPAARQYAVHLDYARLLLAERDFSTARRVLRKAFQNPANQQVDALVTYLRTAGRLEEREQEFAGFELRPALLTNTRRAIFAEFQKAGQTDAALALAAEHPEILDSALAEGLRQLAKHAGMFQRITALFEQIVTEAPAEKRELTATLASVYADWAEAELNALQVEAAFTHLRRGHELRPDHFAVARLLSQLCAERGDRKQAAQTLEAFLAATSNEADRAKAKQLLLRVRL
jgi:tetratricopeptide (TPR) repeat protein